MRHTILRSLNVIVKSKTDYIVKNIKRHASVDANIQSAGLTRDIKGEIETYWNNKLKHTSDEQYGKDKFYILAMFPYPSGAIHMGHVRVYTISDVIARFYRMRGKNVIHPMGWDAFGLPAENAAIEKGIDPVEWTMANISNMREQFKLLNYSFDWDREFATCNPDYYRWTQELFLQLYEKGLVYQKEEFVNWDPVDQTVLAEEQVDADGNSWRSGAKVQKKLLNQWFIRTTAFAKSLLEGLNDPILKDWGDVIKLQKHWIEDCNGMSFDFQLISDIPEYPRTINLWTSAPEFIEFAEFVIISPDSMLNYAEYCHTLTPGIKKLDAKVINPFTNKELPVFVSNEITFAAFRDNHIGIPCTSMEDFQFLEQVGMQFTRQTKIRSHEELQIKLSEISHKAKKWKIGGYPVSSKLKDWLISRQRYWGTPIPIIHCTKCGVQPVPPNDLPIILPRVDRSSQRFTLNNVEKWKETTCPTCGDLAKREVDTMDTFVDSCWYFLRFIDPCNTKEMFSCEKAQHMLPVDLYIGGKEHAVLHLYYARFINHFLHSEGLLPTREPFKQLLVQGMVMGKTYAVGSEGPYLTESEVMQDGNQYKEIITGKEVTVSWQKMSKSKKNGVEPMKLLEAHGVDTTRLLILADVAPRSHRNWSDDTIAGIMNWQNRVWKIVNKFVTSRQTITLEECSKTPTDKKFRKDEEYMFDSRNYFLKTVTFNIKEAQQLSVAISRMQGLTNSLLKASVPCMVRGHQFERALAVQIIMLAPFAPYFASELWDRFCTLPYHLMDTSEINLDKGVLEQNWPEIDMEYKMDMIVHINNRRVQNIKVARKDLDTLTVPNATEMLYSQPFYQKALMSKVVLDVKLHSEEGCDAKVYITMKDMEEKYDVTSKNEDIKI